MPRTNTNNWDRILANAPFNVTENCAGEYEVYTEKQVGKMLQTSRDTLRRWRRDKVGGPRWFKWPDTKHGRVFYPKKEFQQWFEGLVDG